MLRDELLRSKNDEIASCLLSRKRKLTELYYATVGFEGAIADSLYQQKEQAFLDANDLSKGRFFDETTLPSPTHARALSPARKAVASPVTAEVKDQQAAGITPPPTVDGRAPTLPSAASSQRASTLAAAPGVASTLKDAPGSSQPPVPVITPQPTQDLEVPVSTTVSGQPGADQKASAFVPETPLSSQDHDGTDTTASPGAAKSAATSGASPSLEIAPNTLPRKKIDSRPSLTLGPSHSEQPLSPASSIDPYSNNTPAPVVVSPDTSPGEEVSDARKLSHPSPKHNRSMQPRPGLVPSTPDEQLRMEEAQSMQQPGTNGVLFSNEVIQETVNSGIDNDQMDVDQEPVVAPSESKLPGRTGATEAETLSPTGQLPEGAQPGDDAATEIKKPVSISHIQPDVSQPRMTTRVSSGAIRHKSVSEILGETPRNLAHDKSHATGEPQTPDSLARMRFKDRKDREKERTRASTVVFPRQPSSLQEKPDSMDLVVRDSGDAVAKLNEEQDYLFTLFLNRAYAPPRGTNLSTLLASAHKTVSTSNHLLEYQEQMDCRTLRRIYALQNANRWPLRQLKRSAEPPRTFSHMDVLLDHMKWMRTDFREERKWKLAAAKSCADWCAEYVNSDEEHRSLLRVNAKIPAPKSAAQDASKVGVASPSEDTGDEAFAASHPTPDLVPSAEEESVSDGFNEEPRHNLHDTVAPAAIFSLGLDEFNFSIDMTPSAEKLLDELPLYEPVRFVHETRMPAFKDLPDFAWKQELLPVSKFASAKITFREADERPRKRTRYDYSQYADSEHRIAEIPPEQINVALFRPENKPIRDRIHPGHSFRPPTEHPMPSVGFFESRQSSQWTLSEDDELRRLVKEYSYNWSLISSCLTSPSLFTSGAERRTPWECFERWVGLEGLPADMSKTQYFRAYHQRLETAQRTVLAQQQAAQQQQQQAANNGQAQQPVRRRTTQPLRVDRRRSSRHLALLDAMRKLAKKRETILQKQQHASHLASLRKANEANQPKPPISSPAEFSRLKHEREMKLQERQEQYRQQMIAQQRASLVAQRGGQLPNQPQQQPQQMMNAPGRPNNIPPNAPNASLANGTTNGVPTGMTPNVGVNQPRTQPMQGIPAGAAPANGQMLANPMAMKMVPQGQMQNVGARPGMPMQASPDNARVIREANRLQEQQRLLQSRQQQVPQQQGQPQQPQQQFHNPQFVPQGSHSPNLNVPNVNGAPNNPAMIAALQAQGGIQSPSFHSGTPQGVSTPSPRMGQPNPLSGGVVPTISTFQNQIQRANPNLPAEQVNKLATDRLNQYQQQRMSQQAAMNAAAGGMNNASYQVPHDGTFQTPQQPSVPNGGPAMQVPQNQGFSPMMRVPQANQQNRVNVTSSSGMNGAVPQASRSATPQTQRSGSAQAGAVQGSSKSPHPPPTQTASS
ncbi:Chromatin modification-related protein eaf1 [Penicillium canariense]|uniref:Vacuolar import and degradation protein 21 n=1 Tax=Penicillium canariense TaxID=189055 RepID=A0A9W9LU63_9EURO|nr:Chromatin modification-related protein eaf1 [Penicillium canariense]KAJ5176225.1 Chromatin modification-related protein eaf1 [Penicillium canariense]